MDFLTILNFELDALTDEILLLSGLSRERIEEAATELSVGIDLCCGEPQADVDEALDPYDEFQAFARDPGLDYTNVKDSGIADWSRRQKSMAVAWHYARFARIILDHLDMSRSKDHLRRDAIDALKLKIAARKLIEDWVGRGTNRSASTRR